MVALVSAPEWDYCIICRERPARPKMLTCSPKCGKEIQRRQAEDHKDSQDADEAYEAWQHQHGR